MRVLWLVNQLWFIVPVNSWLQAHLSAVEKIIFSILIRLPIRNFHINLWTTSEQFTSNKIGGYVGPITSRCSGNESAHLQRRHTRGTREGGGNRAWWIRRTEYVWLDAQWVSENTFFWEQMIKGDSTNLGENGIRVETHLYLWFWPCIP